MNYLSFIHICIATFFTILFIQSGVDKIKDWGGNLGWLNEHFSKSLFKSLVKPLLIILTALELAAGTVTGLGVVQIVFSQNPNLAQYGLALCAIAYITVKFHLLMRVFPLLQLTATIFALLALYQFLLFWINGVAGVHAPSVSYWGPVIIGTLIWPILYTFLSGMRLRVQLGG